MNVRSFTYKGFEEVTAAVVAYDSHITEAPKIAEPVAPRPVFTTEEMEIAKTISREEGIREGLEQAKKQFDEERTSAEAIERAATQKLTDDINSRLQDLIVESRDTKQNFSDRLAQIALAISKKVCSDVSDKIIESEISTLINRSVEKLGTKEEIKIHLNAENAKYLNDKFTGATVNIDEKMEKGDFRIEWKNGFASRDVKKLWESISEICGRHSSLEDEDTIIQELNTKQEV